MASTYSPALRLELMATGDQSGTWGDTTNTNLGTLLEQAITGYLSVAQGDVANLTLTTTNGASDQARNAVVRITGALTATRNVVIQTAAKLYTIANDTTGGFSIVVKTSGGTGVSVPPGAMVNVYSDGTNAVQAANYWTGSIGGIAYLDAGAAVGPNYDLFRDSTSPAISDILGRVTFNGRDSAGNKQEYGSIEAVIADPTSTSEDGSLDFYAPIAGTRTNIASFGPSAVLRGTATNDSAAAGFIGEAIESTVLVASAAGLTTGTGLSITSISLTAGDWEVAGNVVYQTSSGVSVTKVFSSISTTDNTLDATTGGRLSSISMGAVIPGASNNSWSIPVGPIRISSAGTTTVYLVAQATFTASTLAAYGHIKGRRVR